MKQVTTVLIVVPVQLQWCSDHIQCRTQQS